MVPLIHARFIPVFSKWIIFTRLVVLSSLVVPALQNYSNDFLSETICLKIKQHSDMVLVNLCIPQHLDQKYQCVSILNHGIAWWNGKMCCLSKLFWSSLPNLASTLRYLATGRLLDDDFKLEFNRD